jgi:hypothetical protein
MLLREGVLDAELGGWSLIRRAERVSRPARLNSRRRSVFVVAMPSVAWLGPVCQPMPSAVS